MKYSTLHPSATRLLSDNETYRIILRDTTHTFKECKLVGDF